MEEITMKSIEYKPAETVTLQGQVDKSKQFVKKGRFDTDKRSGNKILSKSAQALVTFMVGDREITTDMKNEILDHYGRSKLTEKLADAFRKDVENGLIEFEKDPSGVIHIKC